MENSRRRLRRLRENTKTKDTCCHAWTHLPILTKSTVLWTSRYNITEGDVIIIGDVHINGLEKTKDNVIRRELARLDIKPGEFYDTQALRKARQRIFRMGSFIRNVEFLPSNSEGAIRDLIVTVTESPRTGLLSLGGGYGTEGGIFGVAQIGGKQSLGTCLSCAPER